ncbi:hypothetical protein HKBW3S03_02186, partial [Candidatus Hakubella thermalkaliphila]
FRSLLIYGLDKMVRGCLWPKGPIEGRKGMRKVQSTRARGLGGISPQTGLLWHSPKLGLVEATVFLDVHS